MIFIEKYTTSQLPDPSMAMASATLSILEKSNVSPPPDTVSDTSLSLTFIDIPNIAAAPVHFVLFYQLPSLTKTQFSETIVPKLKNSLSITLQHFPPFAGNIIVYPTSTIKPEIRYVEGDSVKVTSAECDLDFDDLTGYHPRNCDKFYHLIPPLGDYAKTSDYIKIPVFSLQLTYFPNCGFSMGVTYNHSLADGSSLFCFLNAWTSIAQCGTDESYLANGTLPFYERAVNCPERDKSALLNANFENLFGNEYQPPTLSGPNDKVRGTFVLPRTIIDQLKKSISTQLPELPYVSSFTVTCAYIWSCIAKVRNEDDRQGFMIAVDARRRLDPPIPPSYFGNCATGNLTIAKPTLLTGKEGFITAAKLIGENLHQMLNDKDGRILEDKLPEEVKLKGWPKSLVVIYGSPKLRYYDLDFGWGKPKKFEIVYMDYGFAHGTLLVPMDGGKQFNQDMEISVCFTASQMETFATAFNKGLETYI